VRGGHFSLVTPTCFYILKRQKEVVMAFAYEKVSGSRATEILKQARGPIYTFQMSQVIDKERGLIFVNLGGQGDRPKAQGDSPTYFNLFWKDQVIVFRGYYYGKTKNNIYTFELNIESIYLPISLKEQVSEIKDAIQEAVAVYWGFLKEKPLIVEVQFPTINFY
jgi:hypothetical protein